MGLWFFNFLSTTATENFVFDGAGVYLSLVSITFTLVFCLMCLSTLASFEVACIGISCVSSVVCFLSDNVLVFWVSYEVTILPLLACLYSYSPYSERFLAGWYLTFYVGLTSLPMLLVLLINASQANTLSISSSVPSGLLSAILFLLFITKVPLPPFHAWLPVVHAEASTFVSVALSGYVMKLGLIGVIRFCPEVIVSYSGISTLLLGFSLFFFICSGLELDSKRWLAFLSLVHILMGFIGICYGEAYTISVVALYCLGHGLSAGLLFYLFGVCYGLSGSRNWNVLSLDNAVSNVWRISLVVSLLSVASFPPSLSFISEVFILSYSYSDLPLLLILSAYLFFGGLIPLVLVSSLLVNSLQKGIGSIYSFSFICTLFCLLYLWWLGVVFL